MKHVKPMARFNAVRVFSATMPRERAALGDRLTAWLSTRPDVQVGDTVVTQSSDASFHCLAFTVFYWEDPERARDLK